MFLNGSLISACLGCAFFFPVESEGRSRCILYFKYRRGRGGKALATMNPRFPSENIESDDSIIILMRNFNEIVFLFVFVACERKRKRGEKSSIRGNKIIRNVPLKRSKPNVLRM